MPFLPISTTPQGVFALAQSNREELLDAGPDARIAAGEVRPLDPEEELKGAAEGYVDIEAEIRTENDTDGDKPEERDDVTELEEELENLGEVGATEEEGGEEESESEGPWPLVDVSEADDVQWAKVRDVLKQRAGSMPGKTVKDRNAAVERALAEVPPGEVDSIVEEIRAALS